MSPLLLQSGVDVDDKSSMSLQFMCFVVVIHYNHIVNVTYDNGGKAQPYLLTHHINTFDGSHHYGLVIVQDRCNCLMRNT